MTLSTYYIIRMIKAIFASMSAKQTARVVREVFLESDLELKGINYQSAAMYVRYGMTDAEIRSLGLTRVVPVRRYTGGRAGPGPQEQGGRPQRA